MSVYLLEKVRIAGNFLFSRLVTSFQYYAKNKRPLGALLSGF